MSRNSIKASALTAGRELDALVAENVMGCVVSNDGNVDLVVNVGVSSIEYVKNYSTSISDAWEVVEKLERYRIEKFPNGHLGAYLAGFGDNGNINMGGWGYGETVPLAICRAALKVMEEHE